MWLECSECGECFEAEVRPRICATCGTAGGFFDVVSGPWDDAPPDSFSAAWLHAGLSSDRHWPDVKQAEAALAAR